MPIDEVKAINLKVSPTYERDRVESVTLKSFRKIVGYDTFNSILKANRDESKDLADYYNITVSMMVKRVPEDTVKTPKRDKYDGSKSLAETLDKGFPYDDGDNSIDDQTPNWKNPKVVLANTIGKLNGENVTKEALVNLVKDTDSPITVGLIELEESRSDGDVLSALLGENVTRGALKNLVTDKPAPITTPLSLAQRSDGDVLSALLGENVTRGALKNLVTDKPAPITTPLGLAQIEDAKNTTALNQKGGKKDSDVAEVLDGQNFTKGHLKNIVTDKPAPITVPLNGSALQQQKPANSTSLSQGAPAKKDEKKPAPKKEELPSVKRPAPMVDTMGNVSLGLNMTVGGDKVAVAKTAPNATALNQGVPVGVNPKLIRDEVANESLGLNMTVGEDKVAVSQKQVLAEGVPVLINPKVMKDTMGTAKLGMKMKIGPDDVQLHKKKHSLAQVRNKHKNPVYNPPFNNWSVNQPSPPHAQGLAGKADLGQNIIVDGHRVHY